MTRITSKKALEPFNQVYCDHCEREAFPRVLDKYQKNEKRSIVEFIDNWESLLNPKNVALSKYIYVIGCFLPKPCYDTKICPGLHYRKFMGRPDEHVNSSHPEATSKTKESKPPKRQGDNQEQKK